MATLSPTHPRHAPLKQLLYRYRTQLAKAEMTLRNHDEEVIRRKAEISVLRDIVKDIEAQLKEDTPDAVGS